MWITLANMWSLIDDKIKPHLPQLMSLGQKSLISQTGNAIKIMMINPTKWIEKQNRGSGTQED